MSRWYILQKGRPYGPVTTEAIISDLRAGRLNRQDLIFNERDTAWREVSYFHEFASVFAEVASQAPVLNTKANLDEWVLLVRKEDASGYRQKGPYSRADIFKMIQSGEVALTDYVWRKGLKEWYKLLALTEFHTSQALAQAEAQTREQAPAQAVAVEQVGRQTDALESDLSEITQKLALPQDIEPKQNDMAKAAGPLKVENKKFDLTVKGASPDRQVRLGKKSLHNKSPEAIALRTSVVNYYTQLTPFKKMAFVSGTLATLTAVLFLITYFSSYRDRYSQRLQTPTVSYVAPTTEIKTVPQSVVESPALPALPVAPPVAEVLKKPSEPTPDEPRVEPTFLRVTKQADGSDAPVLNIQTDASFHYPISVTFNSEAGQVLYLRSFLRKIRIYKKEERNLELGSLKLLPGYYEVTVEVENLKKSINLSYATLTTADFYKKLKKQRKQIFVYHSDERYSFVKTVSRLEKEAYIFMQNINNASSLNSWSQSYRAWRRNFDRIHHPILKTITPSNRTNYVHASKWMSLKNLRSKIDSMAKDINKLKSKGVSISANDIKSAALELTKLKEQMLLESLQKK